MEKFSKLMQENVALLNLQLLYHHQNMWYDGQQDIETTV